MRLFKQLLTLVSVFIVSTAHADVPADSVSYYEMVRLAGNSLHQQVMLNKSLKQQGRESEMKFVIEVSPSGGPYLMDEGIGTHAPLLKQAVEEKVKLEARLKAVYDQYHVEAYLLLLNYFDIKRKQQVLGTYTVDEVFGEGLLDDTLNIPELKLYHESITSYIISERKIFDDDGARIVLSVGIYKATSFGSGRAVYLSKVKPNKKNEFVNTQVAALLHSYLSNTKVNPEEGEWAYPRFEVASLESAVSKGVVKAKILSTFAVDSMADLLADYSRAADYAALTLKERLHIMSVLLKEKLSGNYLINDNAEGAVIKILNNTPAEQAEDMLKGLAGKSVLAENKDSGALIYRLYHEVDDRLLYMGGKNATALMTALKNLITSSPQFYSGLSALMNDPEKMARHTIDWQFIEVGGHEPIGFTTVKDVEILSSGQVVVEKDIVVSKEEIVHNGEWLGGYKLRWGDLPSITYEPFDLVSFTNFSDLTVLDEATELKKGELVYVPAVFLMFADHNKLVDDISTTASFVMDVATIATGPGAFVEAVGVIRKGIVLLDVANSTASLALSAMPVEMQNPVFREVQEYTDLTLNIIGGVDFVKGKISSMPAAMRAAKSTATSLSRAAAINFVAAVMRVEVELGQLKNPRPAIDIKALRDRLVKDWKKRKKEDLVALAKEQIDPSPVYQGGWTKEKLLALEKKDRPDVSAYYTKKFIADHLKRFTDEGNAAFIAVTRKLAESKYPAFPVRKYVMLTSDMKRVIAEYRQAKDVQVLEKALGYDIGELKGMEDEIFVFYTDAAKYDFDFPHGRELGANSHWTPGGKTSGGYREAVLIDKGNPDATIVHNRDIESLKLLFSFEKVKDF